MPVVVFETAELSALCAFVYSRTRQEEWRTADEFVAPWLPTAPLKRKSNSDSSAPEASIPPDQSAAGQPAAPSAPAGSGYFVQVAAVSKQEDAEALVESLKGHQYQAIIANQASDKLFHVQVGPFTDIKEAETMRSKLVSDGYNPILKK